MGLNLELMITKRLLITISTLSTVKIVTLNTLLFGYARFALFVVDYSMMSLLVLVQQER